MLRRRDQVSEARPPRASTTRLIPPAGTAGKSELPHYGELDRAARDRDGRPWPARTVVVDGCGVRLRHTPGPDGAQPALYVHGLAGDATNFTDLAAALAPWLDGEAVDLPGFGGSDPAPGGDYSPAGQARTLTRLLDQRGRGPVHLFGNSFGGVVCLLVAATRPDLVRTLTLISPAMPTLRPLAGPARQMVLLTLPGAGRLLARRMLRLTPQQRVRALVGACFADGTVIPGHRLAEAAEEIRRRDRLPWAVPALVGSVRGLASVYLARGRRSLWRQAAGVAAPTLVVWGERDRLVDVALAPRTAGAISRSRLLVLPGTGHAGQMEDAAEVARAFLALLDQASTPLEGPQTGRWMRVSVPGGRIAGRRRSSCWRHGRRRQRASRRLRSEQSHYSESSGWDRRARQSCLRALLSAPPLAADCERLTR